MKRFATPRLLRFCTALLIIVCGVLSSGCSLLGDRNGEYYVGTYYDLAFIKNLNPKSPSLLWSPVIAIPMALIGIIDLPFSLLIDTLLIPYDYHVGKKMGFTIQVVDENAVPVPDALVKGKRYRMFEGTTDPSGKYFWASSSQTVKWFQISKPGYYKTTDPQRNPVRISEQLDASASRTLVVTLKSARNPVPMYAKRAAIEVPGPGDYGYDLMAGALIPPRGNGRITDIIIHIEQVPENNYLLADLRFPGSGNGIRRFDAHHEHGYVPRQTAALRGRNSRPGPRSRNPRPRKTRVCRSCGANLRAQWLRWSRRGAVRGGCLRG